MTPSSNATGRASKRPPSGSSPRTATATASSKATSTTRSIPIGSGLSPGSADCTWRRCWPPKPWPWKWTTRNSPPDAGPSSRPDRRTSSPDSSRGSTSSTSPTRSTWTRSTPARAAKSTRSSARAGRSRSACRACSRPRRRSPPSSRSGATTSPRMSDPTARPISPAAGMPCRARRVC